MVSENRHLARTLPQIAISRYPTHFCYSTPLPSRPRWTACTAENRPKKGAPGPAAPLRPSEHPAATAPDVSFTVTGCAIAFTACRFPWVVDNNATIAETPPLRVPSMLRWPGFVAQAAEAMGAYGVVAKKLVASSRQAFHSLPLLSCCAGARTRS